MEKVTKNLQNGGYPMHTFNDVESIYFLYIKNEEDRENIKKAYDLASKKHEGIFRKSGEPYVQHLIEVAYICATLQAGPTTIQAAFLHDVVEDTDETIEQIKEIFGSDCAKIVDSLTKIQRLKLSHFDETDFEAEDHRKIFLGMAKDVRVIIIKLADRLHNMITISSLSKERQMALANETLDVFIPIAHRLGMYKVESELQDLSLKILNEEEYNNIISLVNSRVKETSKHLNSFKKKLGDIAFKANIPFEISSRVKSVYSIHKKMVEKHKKFDEIYDVLAVRIITDSSLHCYELLGLIHQEYTPIPGRFKDYIAVPKSNMYQSLHTTVISGDGNLFEVQIRTKEMDEIAETGIAAHWAYKEGTNYDPKAEQRDIEDKLHWFRDFVSLSDENSDSNAKEYLDNLTKDIFEANIFVFTPKGKVIDLPSGSTPLDMAYKIHTKIGDTAVGAVINGALSPLNVALNTGDVVEIKTNKNSTPSQNWLDFVKTNSAKTHIKKYLLKNISNEDREIDINKGKDIVKGIVDEYGITFEDFNNLVNTEILLKNYHSNTIDELFYNISKKNPAVSAVFDYLGLKRKNKKEKIFLSKKENFENDNCPVFIENGEGIKINLGKCCTPIPGDDITGYITKGLGVTVHRKDCPNVKNTHDRFIDVYWKENIKDNVYPVDISIECNDRNNLISDVMNSLTSNHVKVTEFNAKLHPENGTCTFSCQIYVKDNMMLNSIFQSLKNISDIYEIKRTIH